MKVKMCRYYVQIDCTEKGPPGVIKLNIPPPPLGRESIKLVWEENQVGKKGRGREKGSKRGKGKGRMEKGRETGKRKERQERGKREGKGKGKGKKGKGKDVKVKGGKA